MLGRAPAESRDSGILVPRARRPRGRGFPPPGERHTRKALGVGHRQPRVRVEPSRQPGKHARAVARTLGQVGFAPSDIKLVLDARSEEMRHQVREFIESIRPGDFAWVYYSGHGVEVAGQNYLLPVDLPVGATDLYVKDEAISAQRILADLSDRGARLRVLILDACRDNPLREANKSMAAGLAPMEGRGALIVFATEAGRIASDSPCSHGSATTLWTATASWTRSGRDLAWNASDAPKSHCENMRTPTSELANRSRRYRPERSHPNRCWPRFSTLPINIPGRFTTSADADKRRRSLA